METSPVVPTSPTCPTCHVDVRFTDFYCYNCGTKLHDTSGGQSSVATKGLLYVGSALLPPAGLFWGLKYLRKPDSSSKVAGLVMIGITIVVLIISFNFLMSFLNGPGLKDAVQNSAATQIPGLEDF